MENIVLLRMSVCCIYMCHMFITQRMDDFMDSTFKKEMVVLENSHGDR